MESEKKDIAMWVMELESKVQALEAERDEYRTALADRYAELDALKAERDAFKTLAWDAILRVRNDHGQLDELWQRYQALTKGGGDDHTALTGAPDENE